MEKNTNRTKKTKNIKRGQKQKKTKKTKKSYKKTYKKLHPLLAYHDHSKHVIISTPNPHLEKT
jgi:hypothetical protein